MKEEFRLTCMALEGMNAPDKDWTKNIEHPRNVARLHEHHLVFRKTQDAESINQALIELKSLIQLLPSKFDSQNIDLEFLHAWGRFQFCSGILMSNLVAEGDDLQSSRGGTIGGSKKSEKTQYLEQRTAYHLTVMPSNLKHDTDYARYILPKLAREGFKLKEGSLRKIIKRIRDKSGT